MGNFETGNGLISNSYWKDIEVEDTACGMFTKKDGRTSTIFCSWRLLSGYFFFELNGSKGYINVDGRFDTHGGDKIFWSINNDKKFYEKDFSDIKPSSYNQEIDLFIKNSYRICVVIKLFFVFVDFFGPAFVHKIRKINFEVF